MNRSLLLLLALTACQPAEAPADQVPAIQSCAFDVRTMPTLGRRGQVGFGYFPAVSEALDRPMAAHGARTNVLAFSATEVAFAERVHSSVPTVANFKLAAVAESSCQHQYLITIFSGAPGTTDLILVDAAGQEVDRVAVTVALTDELLIDRGWSGDSPTVLAGSLQGLHATTIGGGGVLVGTGAVSFGLSGVLVPYPDGDAQPPWWGGDEVTFTGAPGRGMVTADSDGAHVEVPITIVDETELSDVQLEVLPPSGDQALTLEVMVSARAGETPVYGAQCLWSWGRKQQPLWIDGGWIGSTPQTRYRFTVEDPGTYTAVCTLPGGTERSIELSFTPPTHR